NPIARQDSDPVAFADPGGGAQPVREAVGAGIHLAVRQAQLGLFAGIDDRQAFRGVEFASTQVISNVHGYTVQRHTDAAMVMPPPLAQKRTIRPGCGPRPCWMASSRAITTQGEPV